MSGSPAWWCGRVLLPLVAAASVLARWSWSMGDAGYVYGFADHVARGLGYVPWPGGPWTEAPSSLAWTLLLAAGAVLGASPPALAHVLGAASLAGAVAAVARYAERVAPGPAHIVAPLLVATSVPLVVYGASGLEMPLTVLLLAVALERDGDHGVWWALLGVVRLETALLGPLDGVGRGRRWWATFLGPLVLWHGARIAIFGHLLPNGYVHHVGRIDLWMSRIYAKEAVPGSGLLASSPLFVAGLLASGGRERRLALGTLAWTGALVVLGNGDWMAHGRLLTWLVPTWSVVAAVAVARTSWKRIAVVLAGVAVAVQVALDVDASPEPEIALDPFQAHVAWVDAHVPKDALVLDIHGGPFVWYSDRAFVDGAGLADRTTPYEDREGTAARVDVVHLDGAWAYKYLFPRDAMWRCFSQADAEEDVWVRRPGCR